MKLLDGAKKGAAKSKEDDQKEQKKKFRSNLDEIVMTSL